MSRKSIPKSASFQDRVRGLARLPVTRVVPAQRNFRTHNDRQRGILRGLLKEIGVAGAALVWVSDAKARGALRKLPPGNVAAFEKWLSGYGGAVQLIDGHMRAEEIRDQSLPVLVTDLDDREAAKALATFDAVGDLASPDMDTLAKLLEEIGTAQEDGTAELLNELARLAAGDGGGRRNVTEDDAPVDRAEELRAKWRVELGHLWELVSPSGLVHRLLCGDSTNQEHVDRLMAGAIADWMWTDPTYGVSYVGKTKDALTIENDGSAGLPELLAASFKFANRVLSNGAPIYVAHPAGALCVEFGKAFLDVGWHFHETLIWVKDSMVLGHSDYHFKHEPMIYGWKGKNRRWFGGRDKVSTLEYPKPARSESHPTMKPVGLVADCLQNSTAPGALGFEPFSGSGTTLVAAEQTGRACRAMELSPQFVAVGLERMSAFGVKATRLP